MFRQHGVLWLFRPGLALMLNDREEKDDSSTSYIDRSDYF